MRWLWIVLGAIGVVAVFILGAGLENSPASQAKAMDRAAIGLCWQDYERKSLASDERRFIASTCEMMERKFRDKHGVTP